MQEAVTQGIEKEGSNLSGVSAKCYWDDIDYPSSGSCSPHSLSSRSLSKMLSPEENRRLSHKEEEEIKATLRKGLKEMPVLPSIKSPLDSQAVVESEPLELHQTKTLDGVHVKFNHEAGSLLPLALRGRLKHGRHFTFKNILGDIAITFVAEGVEGAFVDEGGPYAAHGPWLQVLIPAEFLEQLIDELEVVPALDPGELPKTYKWAERHFALTILPEQV